MLKIINLTPHAVNLYNGETLINAYEPSGEVARIDMKSVFVANLGGVPLFKTKYGEASGLPKQEDGTYYIVSALVRTRNEHREDLLSPQGLVRNKEGVIIGCNGFDIN